MIHLWTQVRHYGLTHGVDPAVFAALYLARLPFLVGSLAVMVRAAHRHRPVLPVATLFLALGLLPYGYILVFGHDLPPWLIAAASVLAAAVGLQAVRKVRSVIRATAAG